MPARFHPNFRSHRLRRFTALTLLVYEFAFLIVFLPGHTRGAVTVDGKYSRCPACCALAHDSSNAKLPTKQSPSQRDRESCAICHFAARILPATYVDLKLPELKLLEWRPAVAPTRVLSPEFIPSYLGRGPPLAPSSLSV